MLQLTSTLTLANLAGLAFAAILPILIFAYRKRQPKNKRTVPTLFLLKQLPKHQATKTRIKLPLRFFLELLALLLLVAALAQPMFRDRGLRIAILFDNSLSMRAPSGASATGDSHLKQAVEKTKQWLGEQSIATSYSLFISSPKLAQLSSEHLSRDQANSILEKITPSFTPDTLPAEVKEIGGTGRYDQVLVVTDRAVEFAREAASLHAQSAHVDVMRIGAPVPNLYLSNLRIERELLEGNEKRFVATLGLSAASTTTADVSVSLYPIGASGEPLTKIARVFADRTTEIAFSLNTLRAPFYRCVVTPKSGGQLDGILEDNTGWIAASADQGTSLLLVTADAGASGLDGIAGLAVKSLSPEEFAALSPQQLTSFSLAIFHHTAPVSPLPIPTLLIVPPNGNSLFPVRAETPAAKLTSWNEAHPLTQYLRMSLLQPNGAVAFTVPSWAQAVMNIEQGATLVAGEFQGVRLIASGLELLPFEGGRSPSVSILTLNIINWLTASTGEFGSGHLTGSSYPLDPKTSWRVASSSARERALPEGISTYLFEEPGIYRFTPAAGTARTVPVNALFPQESTTYEQPPIELPLSVPFAENVDAAGRGETALIGYRPLWSLLLLAGIIVLVIELLARFAVRNTPEERILRSTT